MASDVRLLDPIDSSKPEWDLIAFYTRAIDNSIQLRLDLLDSKDLGWPDVYIPIDTNPGGNNSIQINGGEITTDVEWDYLIMIPSFGETRIINTKYSTLIGTKLLVIRNNQQDEIIINFDRQTLPINLNISKTQVVLTSNNQNMVVDRMSPVHFNEPSPEPSKVIFVFWNSFVSKTPAQTLRSWMGAHSGPLSSRHGLKYLLDNAGKTKTPIFFMDLFTRENLSALEYINALPQVKDLADKGIIGLFDWDNYSVLNQSREIGISQKAKATVLEDMNIHNIAPNVSISVGTKIVDLFKLMKVFESSGKKFTDFGVNDYAQFTNFGTSCSYISETETATTAFSTIPIDCISQILYHGITNPQDPLIIGGDFSKSFLGSSPLSFDLLLYIRNRPWIQVINLTDFKSIRDLSLIPSNDKVVVQDNYSLTDRSIVKKPERYYLVQKNLSELPNNEIAKYASHVFISMYQDESPDLIALNNNYVGQIGQLIEAAKWAANPLPISNCKIDIDFDGAPECVLSNGSIFLNIELSGGYISSAFVITRDGIHQIIGPTWEFIIGISDPMLWDFSKGVESDPGQTLGALFDSGELMDSYKATINNKIIYMDNPNIGKQKSIKITNDQIILEERNQKFKPTIATIPLVLDPWRRFTHDWGEQYQSSKEQTGYQWSFTGDISIEITSTNQLSLYTFNASRSFMFLPENPDFDYSPGHLLPFPMAQVNVQTSPDYAVYITINP